MFSTEEIQRIRGEFPILARQVNQNQLVYLDNSASSQKPRQVIDAIGNFYQSEYANVHRGLHYLSNFATEKYEGVRSKIAKFINAKNTHEIIYTSGSTEGINIVAYSWAWPRLKTGDEIILSVLEHHANIVPWNFLRERSGIVIKWVEPDQFGNLDPQAFQDQITDKTKLISVTQISNALGTVVDVKSIIEIGHNFGIPILVDASQSAVHQAIDVQDLDVDFLVFTGHKIYGPTASGALYVKEKHLGDFVPFKGGGDMIDEVTRDHITYAKPPRMLEAGTPAIAQMIGLGVAIDYVTAIGMDKIQAHEKSVRDYALERFAELNWLKLYGSTKDQAAIFSFTMGEVAHPHDLSTILDQKGIAVRAGHHCAQPLMNFLGVNATCRASFALYNTKEEVDKLIDGLVLCRKLFD
ncbi:MAG: cysteine desulfurase [Rhodobacteraceae bacterium]|nr:cysteine desulfurase [Paracoccaceae bacterium]MYJ88135.1 cysteine desulfurase [Paracoccaceae bacterium]